jgi:hypothetical protein
MAGTVKWRGPQTGHHTDLNETLLTRGRLLAFPGSFLDCLFCYTSQRSDRSTSPSALASTYQQSVRQGPPINLALVGPPLFSSSRAMQPAKLSLPTLRIATESITCCRGTDVNAAAPVPRRRQARGRSQQRGRVLTHLPAGPRPGAELLRCHFPGDRFGNLGTTPRGLMSKREPQIIL